MLQFKVNRLAWQQINYRSTQTLLAAEFLHGLYQRHDPYLNPIYFCNTIVHFHDWKSISYAPKIEWDLLGIRFGGRILRNFDEIKPELDRIFTNPKTRSNKLLEKLSMLNLGELLDEDFLDLLQVIHHTPLGEIYEINMVQVEHALFYAIRNRLAQLKYSESKIQEIIAKYCQDKNVSASGLIEDDFIKLILNCKMSGIMELDLVKTELIEFEERYKMQGAAYGATTVNLEGLMHRFSEIIKLDEDLIRGKLMHNEIVCHENDNFFDDKNLTTYFSYFKKAGIIRDKNKSLLGKISKYRENILNEISIRSGVSQNELRLYLLEELMQLIEFGAIIPYSVIKNRLYEGVIFKRMEMVDRPNYEVYLQDYEEQFTQTQNTLYGLCASCGQYVGKVKIIENALDMNRISYGDVIVAKGTDFDVAPLLHMAGAIITEEGGMLSHAAVLAREYNLPCIIQVTNACKILKNDIEVIINANNGEIRISNIEAEKKVNIVNTFVKLNMPFIILDKFYPVEMIGQKAATLATLKLNDLPVPNDMIVIPVDKCHQIFCEFNNHKCDILDTIIYKIVEYYKMRSIGNLSVRSSSINEDQKKKSAAGIYKSIINIEPIYPKIREAIMQVILSSFSESSKSYNNHIDQKTSQMAVLITPFIIFDIQGMALSESLTNIDNVLIEFYESNNNFKGEFKSGILMEFARKALFHKKSYINENYLKSLQKVAELCVMSEKLIGCTTEIEWGIRQNEVVVLQARASLASEIQSCS